MFLVEFFNLLRSNHHYRPVFWTAACSENVCERDGTWERARIRRQRHLPLRKTGFIYLYQREPPFTKNYCICISMQGGVIVDTVQQ